MDVAKGEATEKELDGLVRRRHDQRADENGHRPSEELYEEGCRRHAEAQRIENQWEQLRWHTAQARRHKTVSALIIRHHEQEAARLERELGINYSEGDDAA